MIYHLSYVQEICRLRNECLFIAGYKIRIRSKLLLEFIFGYNDSWIKACVDSDIKTHIGLSVVRKWSCL